MAAQAKKENHTEPDRTGQSAFGADTPATPAPWERRDGEGIKAYSAFLAFRNLSPYQRSVNEAWRSIPPTDRPDTAKNISAPSQWRTWAREWEWEDRALAWDAHQQQQTSLPVLETLSRSYLAEIADGEALCEIGRLGLEAIREVSSKKNEDTGIEKIHAPSLLLALESRGAKLAMEYLGKGRDLLQRAHERRREIHEAMAARLPDEAPPALTEEQEGMVAKIWQGLIEKAQNGDPVAARMVLVNIGVIPEDEG